MNNIRILESSLHKGPRSKWEELKFWTHNKHIINFTQILFSPQKLTLFKIWNFYFFKVTQISFTNMIDAKS